VDPDVDVHVAGQRRESTTHRWVVPVIALGGMVGASARHGLELWWPTPADGFPWATFVTNVLGCLLIGILMVHVVETGRAHPLVRPFVGVGVLGGFTTFSTYAVQGNDLLAGARPELGTAYLFGTVAAAMMAVWCGVAVARGALRVRLWLIHRRGGTR
jgi:CrcB protein